MRILALAIAGLLAVSVANSASAASKKHDPSSDQNSNSFKDTSKCLGGGCQGVNPDRVPTPQFTYRSSHRKTRKHKSEPNG